MAGLIAFDDASSFSRREPGVGVIALSLAAFVVLWSVYFAISESQASIHNDMAEAYAWGQEFQLGYHQHPPFWAWICGLWFSVFPRAGWAFAFLSSTNAAMGLLGAWLLIGRFASGDKRVAATALLLLTPFYTFLSYKFNANSIFLSLWPWTLYFFVRAIDSGERRDDAAFGVLLGCALISKYFALLLAMTCVVAVLVHPRRNDYLRSPGPWITIAATLLVITPHLLWLAASGAPPVAYLEHVSGRQFLVAASFAATALLGCIGQLVLVFALVAFAARGAVEPSNERLPASRRRFLAALALTPPILTALAALALRNKISTNMLIGVFSLAPLFLIESLGARALSRLRNLATRAAMGLCLTALALSPAVAIGKAWLSRDSNDTDPRKELAAEATRFWREATGLPVPFVAGSFGYDNGVVFYSPDRPHAFVGFTYYGAGWVTPQAIANHGLLTVCLADDLNCATETAKFTSPAARSESVTLAHRFLGHEAKPKDFVITAIPPR